MLELKIRYPKGRIYCINERLYKTGRRTIRQWGIPSKVEVTLYRGQKVIVSGKRQWWSGRWLWRQRKKSGVHSARSLHPRRESDSPQSTDWLRLVRIWLRLDNSRDRYKRNSLNLGQIRWPGSLMTSYSFVGDPQLYKSKNIRISMLHEWSIILILSCLVFKRYKKAKYTLPYRRTENRRDLSERETSWLIKGRQRFLRW